jgi:hypothetical protein
MKTIFRFFSLAVVVAAGAVVGFAQTTAPTPDPGCADVDGQNAIYTPFTETYNKKPYTIADTQKAMELGKSFLEKFGSCEPVKEQLDFVKQWIPKLEKRKADLTTGAKYDRFDKAVQGKNYDEAFAAGKEILASKPNDANITVELGLIVLDQTYQKNYKFSDEGIRNAKAGIALVKGGATPKPNGGIGAFAFECKKEDCVSDLTFAIAHMTYWGKNDKAGAMPFYYEASQLPGRNKENAAVYEAIGVYYVDQRAPIGTEIARLIEKQKAAPSVDEKLAVDAEITPKVAIFNGYTERIIDALGRAHRYTKDATRKATIYKSLQDQYKLRTNKTEGLDAYVATMIAKPLPNPTSTVEPALDPEPATTTTTTGTTSSAPATPTPPAKPATTTPTKPLSTVGTKVSATAATATSTDTVAKRPVVKKKGTR